MFKLVLSALVVYMTYCMCGLLYEGVLLWRGHRSSSVFHRRHLIHFLVVLPIFAAITLTYLYLFPKRAAGGSVRVVHDALIACFSVIFFPQAILALVGHFTGKRFPLAHMIVGLTSGALFYGICITGSTLLVRLK